MRQRQQVTDRASRAAALWRVWLINVALGTAIGSAYLNEVSAAAGWRVWVFATLGLLSTIAILTSVPAAIAWSAARWLRGDRAFIAVQSATWMLFHVALYIDTRIYNLFRYHFNGSAWNLLTSRGSEDSFELGPTIWIAATTISTLLFVGEWLVARWAMRVKPRQEAPPGLRWRWIAVLAVPVLVEKSIYASADLTLDRAVTDVSQVLPFYARVTLKPLLPPTLKESLPELPRPTLKWEGKTLAYPLEQPRFRPGAARPNILIVAVDSWRRDMLDPEVTPNLWEFAQQSRRFTDHASGGNATRFGLFSLFYGLHGTYWWPVLAEGRSPVLLDALEALGYDLRIFSSATMDYPEFRRCAFASMPERVLDDFGAAAPHQRDELVADACIAWWNERREQDDARPFFGFVLLDSPHQVYDFPPDRAPFVPFAPELDYLEMAGSDDPELVERVVNRYKNALHHADRVAWRILSALRDSDPWRDTIVIATGDHGEEFAEHGYWGHTSNFSREQTLVPFAMRGPRVPIGVESRPTSHLDVASTLLELLGADPAQRSLYCVGENLLDPPAARSRTVAAWEEIGLWTSTGIFRLPMSPEYEFRLGAYDHDWRPLLDSHAAFERESAALERLTEECARFLRPVAAESAVASPLEH